MKPKEELFPSDLQSGRLRGSAEPEMPGIIQEEGGAVSARRRDLLEKLSRRSEKTKGPEAAKRRKSSQRPEVKKNDGNHLAEERQSAGKLYCKFCKKNANVASICYVDCLISPKFG